MMQPPGKTTLTRMLLAAYDEARRIECSQEARMQSGLITEYMPEQVTKRDDFDGMVRLIEKILADSVLLERLNS